MCRAGIFFSTFVCRYRPWWCIWDQADRGPPRPAPDGNYALGWGRSKTRNSLSTEFVTRWLVLSMGSEAEPGRERKNRYRRCHCCNKALRGYLLNQLQSIELGDETSLGALKSQSGCGILPRPEDSIIQVGWWCWQRLWTCLWNSEWELAIQEMKQRLGSETRKYQEGRKGGERAGCAEWWALAKVSWGVGEPLRERSWLVPGS